MTDLANPGVGQTDKVTITLDGRQVEATPGEMIITAAERNGVYIPRFCHHPRLKPVGMCRMCLVQVVGPRGPQLQPACFVPVADGQEVITDSPAVKKAQDGILEFLLVNHPLDCPVCDKGGECPLQDQTLTFGPGETRFVEEKRHWEKPIPLSELVLLDRERCIQCARCIRFADEVAGDPQIGFVNRGERTEVAIAPGRPFTSYFSGNTIQICPVGALTSAPYRFKARPWDLEQVESTCTMCAVGCRIAVQSSSNQLTRYLGIDSDPVNHGWLCDKGRFSYDNVNSAERITTPLVREGDQLRPASWGEALAAAAKGLSDVRSIHGPEAIGVVGGARLANEDAYAWAKLAKGVLGTDSVDCQIGDGIPAEAVLGLPRATIDDACRASAVIVLGPDLKEELPVLHLRLRHAVVEDSLTLIEVVGTAGALSEGARATLSYRPGEIAALARALAGSGTDEVAGVGATALNTARLALHSDDPVIVLGRPNLAESGESVAEAAGVLAAAFPRARFLSALRRANVHGALDMGLAPGVLPGRVSLDAARTWYGERWPGVPATRGLDTAGMLRAAADGKLQAMVLLGADPLSDFPDRQLARRAVAGAGFVVAVESHHNESTRHADVVLPVAMFAERPGTTTNLEGRVTRLGQKRVAPEVVWPDWMVASELAARLGADLGFATIDSIWDEIEQLAPSHRGITRALLGSRLCRDGVVVPLTVDHGDDTALAHPEASDVGSGAVLDAAGGTIDPNSDPGIDAVESQGVPAMGVAPATTGSAPADAGSVGEGDGTHEADGGDPADPPATRPDGPPLLTFEAAGSGGDVPALDAYSLRLVSGRSLYDQGTLVQATPALAGLAPAARLRANPYDLDRLGVGTGGRVRVTSPRATFVMEAVADAAVPRGSAAIPFNLAGDGAADLIDAAQPVTDLRIETV